MYMEPRWLERMVAEGMVSSSIPGPGKQKNLLDVLPLLILITSISAGISYDTKPRTTLHYFLQNTLHIGTGYRSISNSCRSFPPEWPIVPSVVCLRKVFLLQVTHEPHVCVYVCMCVCVCVCACVCLCVCYKIT